jgi:hypothetical protein
MRSFLDDYVLNKNNEMCCRCCPDFKPVKYTHHWKKHIESWKHDINKNPKYKHQTQIENNLLDEVNDVESFVINKDGDYICKCCPNFTPVNKYYWLRHSKSNKHKKNESLIKQHLDKEVLNDKTKALDDQIRYKNLTNMVNAEREEFRKEINKLKEEYELRRKNLYEEKELLSIKHELLDVLMRMNLEIYSMTNEDRHSNTIN